MTTRRSVLRLAGAAAGLTALGACTSSRTTGSSRPSRPADLLFVATTKGLVAIEANTGKTALPGPATLATPDWSRVVSAEPDGDGIRLVARNPRSGQIIFGGTLRGRLEPRVVSPDGRFVALATPVGPKTRTTIAVADSGGERVRYDLPGNLDPEAFSASGADLYVLDYLPPAKPDRYRVRVLNLKTGRLEPLATKSAVPVPAGAEETMRGEGRQGVYDERRRILFTLYTHQPDHLHTRDLLAGGARPGAPHIHAFVHSLHLEQGWAFCIDLPSPFGEGPAAGHAIALRSDGGRLYVLDAGTGTLADIDPEALSVSKVSSFTKPGVPGEASAVPTRDGGLVVGAGTSVLSVGGGALAATAVPVRGVALTADRLYVGQPDTVVTYHPKSGEALDRLSVPGLVAVKHATTP